MSSWGATTIAVKYGTYQPPHASAGLNKIETLGDPSDLTKHIETIQQNGRSRKAISFDGLIVGASPLTTYDSLLDDHLAATTRTWTGPDGGTLDCIIGYISPPEWTQSNLVKFSAVLWEA